MTNVQRIERLRQELDIAKNAIEAQEICAQKHLHTIAWQMHRIIVLEKTITDTEA